MSFKTLNYEVADRVALVTFATPETLNALTEERFADLEGVLDAVEANRELGALILTATGKAFCVGLDLDLLDRAFNDIGYFEAVVRRLSRIIARLEALPIPTIAAVNGFARAGGFELCMGCDFMVIAEEARIGDVHTDAGVLPATVTTRLSRRVGEQIAKEMLWSARWYSGPEAVEIGLARKAVPLDRLVVEARAYAATMTDKPAPAIAALKRTFIDGAALDVLDATEMELRSFVRYMGSEPYGREGYRAFREKRQPTWKRASAAR